MRDVDRLPCDPLADTAELPVFEGCDGGVKRIADREFVVARVEALVASGKVAASVVQRRLSGLLKAL
jgi:hypothetical protein